MKNIILLSDGTGNAASKVWRTNVWRTFQSLDLDDVPTDDQPYQVAMYADGVGTSNFKPLALLGGMFGLGLKKNVIECYKFVCRTYEPGDQIYGFGFSRGAYTMRVAMKLILTQGLVKYNNNEVELDRHARTAYRIFRRENVDCVWYIKFFRWLRDIILRNRYNELKSRKGEEPNIRFLGLWDTVAAYGLPVDEMTRFYSKWIYPFEVLDAQLNPKVERACHALSIDDERTTFHPKLWTEKIDETVAKIEDPRGKTLPTSTSGERLSQVWFPGVHANVGGGYPDDSLAQVSLSWILKEAVQCGLRLKIDPDALRTAKSGSDKDGRLYNSRSGLASYYRYGPRDIWALCHSVDPKTPSRSVTIDVPKFHYSVFERIKLGAHPYAPIGIPDKYAVVLDDGRIARDSQIPYEKPTQAELRFLQQRAIWDGVWRRRWAYFGTIAASAFLVLYPFFHKSETFAEYSSNLRPLSDLIRFLGSFIPTGYANFWIDEYARDPIWFICSVAVLIYFIVMNARIGARIADEMRKIWKLSLGGDLPKQDVPATWVYTIRNSIWYNRLHTFLQAKILPTTSAVVLGYLLVTIANHVSFNLFDAGGRVCRESTEKPPTLAIGQSKELTFDTSNLCQSAGILLERNGRYLIQFSSTASFHDNLFDIDGSKGFTSSDIQYWHQRSLLTIMFPLRREWFRPWFNVVARFGGSGGEEAFLDPDVTDKYWIDEVVRATRDGELFLFVNSPVIGIPGLFGAFYGNNSGMTTVMIKRRS